MLSDTLAWLFTTLDILLVSLAIHARPCRLPEPALHSAGIGLESMRGRANALGGELHIRSSPGHGVRIEVQLPC